MEKKNPVPSGKGFSGTVCEEGGAHHTPVSNPSPRLCKGAKGELWWNHALVYYWDLRKREYVAYVSPGRNFSNDTVSQIMCRLWALAG